MPVCENCSHQWTWFETMKSSWTLDTGWKCPSCGVKQYATKKSRKRTMLATMTIPLFILLQSFTDFSAAVILGGMITWAIAVLVAMPFLMDIQNEEEPMW